MIYRLLPSSLVICVTGLALLDPTTAAAAQLPEEKPLWTEPGFQNAIHYDVPESVRENKPAPGSPSGSNRVYSFVTVPTYSIHQADEASATGVGLVICPGGGYRDVWLDREGHDLALWLKAKGVTSLVLKYRTDADAPGGGKQFPAEVYNPAVLADARQAIRILRSRAAELHLKVIGICGFSAGGNLAFNAVFRPEAHPDSLRVSGEPDFAGLFYPGLREEFSELVASAKRIPPIYIINAADDTVTPANRCVELYQALLKAGSHPELHVFSKGSHGFDLGEGRGASAPLWKESFVAWLKDAGLTQPKPFISYFLPTPPQGSLVRETWGAAGVLPRDTRNGLEENTMKNYCYWDGQIMKGPDGKFHMFASRWDESKGHNGWFGSVAVHAVSDALLGPYVDRGLCWPNDQGGKGHNVTALTLPDGRYAIVISETRPCEVYVSSSLDGPWEHLGTITVEGDPKWHASNVSIMARPDGHFEFVPRDGRIFYSDRGILGPYKPQGASVFPRGIPNLEDPCIWYSGGWYHIVVNSWSTRKAYHLTSRDGIHDWINRGVAYDPREAIVRYPDSTVNYWNKAERPSVYIENGHVVAMTLAVIDVEKEQDKGNDGHGSKVIVIPFDGATLDRDVQSTADLPKPQ
ncbi:MAG: dienelactone hydrolase family protein [Verrucomicrobiia bacterium]